MQFPSRIKKFLLLAGGAITISCLSLTNANADNTALLTQIANNTLGILNVVNNIPQYMVTFTTYMSNWTDADGSSDSLTGTLQGYFSAVGTAVSGNLTTQNNQQMQITADMLGINVNDLTNPKNSPAVLTTDNLPQVNSLAFSTLLTGQPLVAKGSYGPYDYMKNAAGFALIHDTPNDAWSGNVVAKARYKGYFNTIMSVASYDAYLLSSLWAEVTNGSPLTAAQSNLLAQASSSGWLQQVASEEIGLVLRQLLMFESQNYVLQTQILQTQKQQLLATAMTNTLLIAIGQQTESTLNNKAQGLAG